MHSDGYHDIQERHFWLSELNSLLGPWRSLQFIYFTGSQECHEGYCLTSATRVKSRSIQGRTKATPDLVLNGLQTQNYLKFVEIRYSIFPVYAHDGQWSRLSHRKDVHMNPLFYLAAVILASALSPIPPRRCYFPSRRANLLRANAPASAEPIVLEGEML